MVTDVKQANDKKKVKEKKMRKVEKWNRKSEP